MSIAFLFWLVYILVVIFGFIGPVDVAGRPYVYGRHLVLMLLIGLLGWHVFGAGIHQ
jgi:hypothetical protein